MKQMARQMELFHLTGIRFCSATLMDLLIKKVVIIFVLCRSLSLEMRYRFVSHVLIILKHAGWLIEFNECGSFYSRPRRSPQTFLTSAGESLTRGLIHHHAWLTSQLKPSSSKWHPLFHHRLPCWQHRTGAYMNTHPQTTDWTETRTCDLTCAWWSGPAGSCCNIQTGASPRFTAEENGKIINL